MGTVSERVLLENKSEEELFNEFLDTDNLSLKREIIRAGGEKFTRRMINTMAISCDLAIKGDSAEEDLERIAEYLSARIRYEGRR